MKTAAILGVTGYTGEELVRLLSRHPEVELVAATSENENGKKLGDLYPPFPRFRDLTICTAEQALQQAVDLVFLCLPAIESSRWGKFFLDRGSRVIDLGADFRFSTASAYEAWYGTSHPFPELLEQAVYGLPEWRRQEIRTARLIGNPGCYPTAALLALLPFVQAGWVAEEPVLVDAKSGVSGAGKTPTKTTHYVEANENVNAYKPGRSHRHVGEIDQELNRHSQKPLQVVFTPHLVPQTRGLYASVYFKLRSAHSRTELNDLLRQRYEAEPFIRIVDPQLPATRMALHSNFCFLAAEAVKDTSYAAVFSAIDNLGKGAAGQAVQNMNLMFGFPETMGLC
ncbi:MAG TPA: N-acetyl-gamma-glutamyl-phosphate reductase [bacterium]|nr:N-acetyl-gamma-glutamyl-phosphate reductase [bacterium]